MPRAAYNVSRQRSTSNAISINAMLTARARRLRSLRLEEGDQAARWQPSQNPQTVEFETRAKNLLKSGLKLEGMAYAQLAEKLAAMDIHETERNLNNKLSRGLQCGVLASMSDGNRRDRYALIALVSVLAAIVVVVALTQPPDPQIAQTGNGDVAQYEYRDIAQLVAAIRDFNPWEDTAAQWAMAVLAAAATGVSIYGIRLLKRTLDATRDSANVAREVGRAQVRAYVTCTGGEIHVDSSSCTVLFEFENRGQSPAFEIRVSGRASIRNLDMNEPFEPATSDRMNGLCELVASGATGRAYMIFVRTQFTPVAYSRLFDRRATIHFMVRVTWKDVFGDKQSLWLLATPTDLAEGETSPTQLLPVARIGRGWNAKLSAYNRPAPDDEPEPEID